MYSKNDCSDERSNRESASEPDGAAASQLQTGGLNINKNKNAGLYCNIRGLLLQSNRNKVKYLRDTAIESNAPFIVITETHLKPEILDPEVKIDGWSLYRTDRGPEKHMGEWQYI